MKKGLIFVFSAASGAGKNTLINHAKASVPDLVYSISATTRSPRGQEKDGVDYFFLTETEFCRRIAANEFAEWAKVHNHYYGTPRSFIDQTLAAGKHIVMDIDVYGKKMFDAIYPQAIGIFIVPPGMDVLEQRLRGRGTDSDETIRQRLINAKAEMEYANTQGKYEHTVVNGDLATAKQKVVALISSHITRQ